MRTRRTEDGFRMLLGRWLEGAEDDRAAVTKEILSVFEESLAIFVLDMSGSSSSTAEHGIVHFLALIHQMRELTHPLIHAQGGEVVGHMGDDVVAVFDEPNDAYRAACRIAEAIGHRNARVTRDLRIHVSIGIGFGPTLFVPGVDVWGDQVNQAFKLGEGAAGPGEILMTGEAYRRLDDPSAEFERLELTLSGLPVEVYSRRAPR